MNRLLPVLLSIVTVPWVLIVHGHHAARLWVSDIRAMARGEW